MRLVCVITFLTWLLLQGSTLLAIQVELVSKTATGNPGQADSGSIRGGSEMRSASVLDNGTVFFVSLAQWTPEDTNALADYYQAAGSGTISAVDLPSGLAIGHFYWGGTDAAGGKFYLARQLPDPSQFELRFGTLANKTSLGVRSLITSAAFARGGTYAVHERNVSGFRHLFLQNLSDTVISDIELTVGNNGDNRSPALSDDGARIVFSSTSSNIVAEDTNALADIFLYERAGGAFTLISQRIDTLASNAADSPDISGNGQVICFSSADPGFVTGDTNAVSDVFVYHNGAMQRCSVASDGTQANAGAFFPRLNGNGRFVVFVSTASNLVPGVGNGFSQVFLFDRDLGQLEAISRTSDGTPADADCFVPEISPGGRYVTFVSKARNFSAGVDGAYYQIYRADRGVNYANHPPTAESLSLAAPQGTSIPFTLTATDADQDEIQFIVETQPEHGTLTDAGGAALDLAQPYDATHFPWNFVPGDGSVFTDSFSFRASDGKTVSSVASVSIRMLDPDLGDVVRLSIATDGSEGSRDSYLPYPGLGISADGSRVVFSSTASELDAADDDSGFADIFLRDTIQGSTRLLTPGGIRTKNYYRCVLSGDGRTTVYYSEDGNELILQDLASGVRTSVATISSFLSNSGPGISDDGMRVIYEKDGQVWLFERALGATVQVSVNVAGATANANCADAALSGDGRTVVFSSTATNLDPVNPGGVRSLYLRLLDENLTLLISTTQNGQLVPNAIKPALSGTGRYVAFLADTGTIGDGVGTLFVKDLAKGTLRQFSEDAANPAISADGRFLCYTKVGINNKNQLYRADLAAAARSVQLASNAMGQEGDGDSYRGLLSSSGRFVAFASKAENLEAGDSNGKCDVFLNDFGMPPNERPVPSLSSITIDKDTPLLDIPLTYHDAEDNDIHTEIVSGPAHADLFVFQARSPLQENATFSYLPNVDYIGEDSFTYRCGDAGGWSAPVTVTITIRPVNKLPLWTSMPVLWKMTPGQQFTLDLSQFVEDPDTPNPDPENFFFSLLEGAPEARIEGSVLIISAEGVAGNTPIFLRIGVGNSQDGPFNEFGSELAIHVRPPVEISLKAGWNLISFPMPFEPSAAALLLTADDGTQYPVWYCDAKTASFHRAETLKPGKAYWVFCSEIASISMQVAWQAPVDPAVEMMPGWNLVGPLGIGEDSLPAWTADGSPIPQENIWGWDGAKWVHAKQNLLQCGQGYWIYSDTAQAATLELEPADE